MKDFIIILIIVVIVSFALYYIYKNKNCKKCIGCHLSSGCSCKNTKCSVFLDDKK